MATERRVGDEIQSVLESAIPNLDASVDEAILDGYTADSYWKGLVLRAGHSALGRPDVVVRPRAEEEVAAVLQVASEHGTPVTAWGGGSGAQGGSVPANGGIVVDLRSLDRILAIDEESMVANVQAGKNGRELEADLNDRGLMFPHYPASAEWATVGGYIAARGSGVLSTRHGKIEDLVVSLSVAMPDGSMIETLPVPRHAVGPDIGPLIIGSEGTLGIITSATLQLCPMPATRLFGAVLFPALPEGVEAFRRVMVAGLRPSVIRLYDEVATPHTLKPVLGSAAARGVCAILMFEGEPGVAQAELDATVEICKEHQAELLDERLGSRWWDHRYDFYHPPHYPTLPEMWGTFDMVARYDRIMPAYDALQDAIAKPYAKYGLQLRTHFSHWYPWGTMYYARFVMPEPPQDDPLALHERIWQEGIDAVLAAGGVLNDHHGVGSKLAQWMPEQLGPGFDTLQKIKDALDPAGVMNPGKLGFRTRSTVA